MRPLIAATFLTLALSLCLCGCKKKIDGTECTRLIDRYSALVVSEYFPDASAEQVQREQQRVREEARGDENFGSCVSQVTRPEYDCAMAAKTASAIEKCLE